MYSWCWFIKQVNQKHAIRPIGRFCQAQCCTDIEPGRHIMRNARRRCFDMKQLRDRRSQ